MPKQRHDGKVQLNVWITREAKCHLDECYEREGRHYTEQIEDYIRHGMAVRNGEIIEQHSLPVISEIVEATLQKHLAQFRTDLR